MIGKAGNLLIAVSFVLLFCSREDKNIVPEPEIHTEKYQLEIASDHKIKKVSLSSYDNYRNYSLEYFYYTDSVFTVYQQEYANRTVYYLNKSGLADSCQYYTNTGQSDTKSYFTYNTDGYLIAKKDQYLYSSLEFTDKYVYDAGNLTRIVFDPKKPSAQAGKYISYTYNAYPNLIDIKGFRGAWLGKLNSNLIKSFYVGGSMSDVAPCSNYEYKINSQGLVETMTMLSCNTNKVSTIISFEYKIVD
jgi:hypothetical protein